MIRSICLVEKLKIPMDFAFPLSTCSSIAFQISSIGVKIAAAAIKFAAAARNVKFAAAAKASSDSTELLQQLKWHAVVNRGGVVHPAHSTSFTKVHHLPLYLSREKSVLSSVWLLT